MHSVTAGEIEQELKRLGAVYNPPKTEPFQVARIWADALEGVTPDEFKLATQEYIRGSSRYFPKPAEIRELAFNSRKNRPGSTPSDLKARYLSWEQTHEGGCPVCGAVVQWVTAAQRGDVSAGPDRLGVHHDYRMHKDARVPHVGWPHAPIAQPDAA